MERPQRSRRKGLGWFNWLILIAILGTSAWWFHFRHPSSLRADTSGPAAAHDPAASAAAGAKPAAAKLTAPPARPAMSVTTARPTVTDWPIRLAADGNIAAWQEVSISPEVGGYRLAEVLVNVGDRVVRGQPLAILSASAVANDVAQQTAALAEAKAALAEASANAQRARRLRDSGAISEQQVTQYLTAETTARARVQAADARIRSEQLRLSQTRVEASDDGVISVRTATVGAVAQPGAELFRLIRQGRLEWRAEVPAADLSRIAVGQAAQIRLPDGATIAGTVRTVAPTIDPQTRNGIVYVDLAVTAGGAAPAAGDKPENGNAARNDKAGSDRAGSDRAGSDRAAARPAPAPRAGMFARGEFLIGQGRALTVPASSVLVRDGYTYVFRLGPDNKVAATKVVTGRRQDDRIEIVDGIRPEDTIVDSGVGFLGDGELVAVAKSPA
ncbi:MAG: efflux RND transporter periplasmic adaptor subunit [Lautropia sp.]